MPSSISLSALLEYDKVAFDKTHVTHMLVNLEGAKHAASNRKPLAISVSIDCSSSMAGQKIDYAKLSLQKLIEHLTAEDTLSIVGFSNSVWTVLAPTRMASDAKDSAKAKVQGLRYLSSTNLSGATVEAYGHLRSGREIAVKDALARAFLFTDGLPTSGETHHDRLIEIAGTKPEGAGLTAFGYGTDHDPELLLSMAKKGGGNFYFVKTPDECPSFFGRELGGLLSCVAQGVKVKIKAAAGVKILEVLNDFDVDANKEQTEATITVDDVYSEETRRVLVKLELPKVSKAVAARPSKVCDVEIEFHDLRINEPKSESVKVKIEYVKSGNEQAKPHKEVEEQIALLVAAKAHEEARKFADAGNFAGAQSVLRSAALVCSAVGTPLTKAVEHEIKTGGLIMVQDAQAYAHGGVQYVVGTAGGYKAGRGYTSGSAQLFDTERQSATAASFGGSTVPADPAHMLGQPIVHPAPVAVPPKFSAALPKGPSKRRKNRR